MNYCHKYLYLQFHNNRIPPVLSLPKKKTGDFNAFIKVSCCLTAVYRIFEKSSFHISSST